MPWLADVLLRCKAFWGSRCNIRDCLASKKAARGRLAAATLAHMQAGTSPSLGIAGEGIRCHAGGEQDDGTPSPSPSPRPGTTARLPRRAGRTSRCSRALLARRSIARALAISRPLVGSAVKVAELPISGLRGRGGFALARANTTRSSKPTVHMGPQRHLVTPRPGGGRRGCRAHEAAPALRAGPNSQRSGRRQRQRRCGFEAGQWLADDVRDWHTLLSITLFKLLLRIHFADGDPATLLLLELC